jgi:PPOX class probable F420-dependent enzyme
MATLPAQLVEWVDGKAFATLATIEPDGRPQLSILWVSRDGDDLLMSTKRGRRKERNLSRDPRATVLVPDPADPYRFVEVRGRISMTAEGGRELIDHFAQKYNGQPTFTGDRPGDVRVVLRLHAEHVVTYG